MKVQTLYFFVSLFCFYYSDAFFFKHFAKLRKGTNRFPNLFKSPQPVTPMINVIRGGMAGNGDGGDNNNGAIFSATGEGEPDHDDKKGGLIALLKTMSDLFEEKLIKYPYTTKIISTSVIGGLGDILVQLLQIFDKKAEKLDFRRLAVMMSVCGVFMGPFIHVWFNFLETVPIPGGSTGLIKVLIMLAIDQTIGCVLGNGGFIFSFEVAQRVIPPYSEHDISIAKQGVEALKQNLWPVTVANWCCWPLINFTNFMFIPLHYRIIFSNFAAVFWNMYLSKVSNDKS